MQFIVETLSLHDEIGNRFFSIVGPLLILYALVYQFLGEKIAGLLLKNDTYCECKIRIRPYFILQRLLVVGVFAYGIILSASCGGFVQMAMFIVVLGGYFCIFIFSPCAVRVRYTQNVIFYQERNEIVEIPMCDVSRMAWKTVARSPDYALVIYLNSGRTFVLHSEYYIGLTKLRELFDSLNCDKA